MSSWREDKRDVIHVVEGGEPTWTREGRPTERPEPAKA